MALKKRSFSIQSLFKLFFLNVFFLFCQASKRRGNLQTKVRVSCDKCTVSFFLWSEYNQNCFCTFQNEKASFAEKKKSVKSIEKKYSQFPFICVYYSFLFFLNEKTNVASWERRNGVFVCERERSVLLFSAHV